MAGSLQSFDFLVLGSGIAGLTFALQVAPYGRVAIITKKHRAEIKRGRSGRDWG